MNKRTMRVGLFGGLLLLGNVAMAAVGSTIKVTTDVDENGTGSACSLREALYVVNSKSKAPWGGCPEAAPVGQNIIQLEAKTYRLTAGELVVLTDVTIQGADTTVEDDELTLTLDESLNPYTGVAPYRKPPVTIIDAEHHSRIINSFGATGSSIVLKDVALKNGTASTASNVGNGGAIYAALSLSLSNVVISGSVAPQFLDNSGAVPVYRGGMGGAVFLSKNGSGLSAEDTSFVDNKADRLGGAIAMVCDQDLSLASHTIALTRSLLARNESITGGAGAIEACGLTTVELSASTLSANKSVAVPIIPTPTAAPFSVPRSAVTYLQSVIGQGSVTISNVTAAEHAQGAVFAFKDLSSVSLNNSLLIGNDGGNCDLDPDLSFLNGNYNSIDDDDCDALLLASTGYNPRPATGQFGNMLLPLQLRGGLTAIYLLKAGSADALNEGPDGDSCTGTDQRGLSRKNGAKCDIGAAERMEPTAVDDKTQNGSDSRVIAVDVLANDSFGESDSGPNRYPEPSEGVIVNVDPADAAVCVWHDKNDANEDYRNRLVIDNQGVITGDSAPVICSYTINVMAGGLLEPSPLPATVTATVSNIPPIAVNDVYVRSLGVKQMSLDFLANDTDADDDEPFASGHDYIIYISAMPVLGSIEGRTGLCPGSTSTSASPKTCYARDLVYIAKDPQSPFTDSIQYSVYDDDGSSSGTAVVTIKTNAPDPDKGETGGSMDLAGMLLLSLLGLRRARKL